MSRQAPSWRCSGCFGARTGRRPSVPSSMLAPIFALAVQPDASGAGVAMSGYEVLSQLMEATLEHPFELAAQQCELAAAANTAVPVFTLLDIGTANGLNTLPLAHECVSRVRSVSGKRDIAIVFEDGCAGLRLERTSSSASATPTTRGPRVCPDTGTTSGRSYASTRAPPLARACSRLPAISTSSTRPCRPARCTWPSPRRRCTT